MRTRLWCLFPDLTGKYREFFKNKTVLGFERDKICSKNSALRADFPKNCDREIFETNREQFLQIRETDSRSRDPVIHYQSPVFPQQIEAGR